MGPCRHPHAAQVQMQWPTDLLVGPVVARWRGRASLSVTFQHERVWRASREFGVVVADHDVLNEHHYYVLVDVE